MSDHQTSAAQSFPNLSKNIPVIKNPDGTITRLFQTPNTPATPEHPNPHHPALSKDVPLNPEHNTWVRIFLPRQALDSPSTTTKLPLIVYYHGGGFVLLSAASRGVHDFCVELAVHLGVVIVSVEYRLAPEHRLPAAYDDAMEALQWLGCSHDEWLRDFADFSLCFLMGSSAGGNIAYHAGLRVAARVDDHGPLKIRGLILHHPYFGGSKRTESELRLVNDMIIPLSVNNLMWELALPIGADRDHEYCNSTVGDGESQQCERLKLMGCKVMVTGCDGDPLIDRQIEFAKMLEKKGVQVVAQFTEGGFHTVEMADHTKAKALFLVIKNFIYSTVTA